MIFWRTLYLKTWISYRRFETIETRLYIMYYRKYNEYFDSISKNIFTVETSQLELLTKKISTCSVAGKKVIIIGNGGSAAIASHVSVDFTKACKIRSVNFNEADLLTCYSNDFGYEHWVSEALKSYADYGDFIILISSSGNSANMVNGLHYIQNNGFDYATFTGFYANSKLKQQSEFNFWVNSNNYNIVEMTHHIWLLSVVEKLGK